jgi:hypothetical protein
MLWILRKAKRNFNSYRFYGETRIVITTIDADFGSKSGFAAFQGEMPAKEFFLS